MPARSLSPFDKAVPVFFLFGEAPRSISARFLHIETIEERSRPSNWNIRAHAHADLHHIFLISHGMGRMNADGIATDFVAPCVLTVPARAVHGFAWRRNTQGQVVTLADGTLRGLLAQEPAFAPLFTTPCCLPDADAPALASHLAALSRELAWAAPGHETAITARLQIICVEALRLQRQQAAAHAPPTPGRAVELVARFRRAVEANYRTGALLDDYAARLGVSPSTLRRACLQAAGCPPVLILHGRILLEAQRLLLFTNMTVQETAAALGFDDCAYFSRFFTKRVGKSPRAFRVAGM